MPHITDIAATMAQFAVYLQVERGLSANTAAGYASDVDKLTRYLADEDSAPDTATPAQIQQFVC